MPCTQPDGKLTATAIKMVTAVDRGASTAEAVACCLQLPLYQARSGLRELAKAGVVTEVGEATYVVTSPASSPLASRE